jgi:hypothetical protein
MIASRPKCHISLILRHGLYHDRRSRISGFPVAGRGRSDFGVRNRRPPCRQQSDDQGVGGDAGPGAQLFRCRDISAGPQALWRDLYLDRGRRPGGRGRGAMREDAGVRSGNRKTRRSHRQRLLRRLHSCRSRPAGWSPRHHALAAHSAFSHLLSQGETGARPDFRATAVSGVRRGSAPASIWRWRLSRKILATRSRRKPRESSCSITGAAAASHSSPRSWN